MTCENCNGTGKVTDSRYAGVSHRRTAINLKCRYCEGTSHITPITDPVVNEPGDPESLEWMLSWED